MKRTIRTLAIAGKAIAETLLGLVLAAVPVALWIAWSPLVFGLVLGICLVCAALLIALDGGSSEPEPSRRGPLAAVPEDSIDELHRLFPMTYHHGRRRDPRFHGTMEKLRQRVG